MFKIGQPLTRRHFGVAVVGAIGVLILGYGLGNLQGNLLTHKINWLDTQSKNLYQKIERLEYQKNILQVEFEVEKSATEALQKELKKTLDEKADVARELAFYQRVMAPELDAKGVAIDTLVISPLPTQQTYYFRLILLQLERTQQLVQGEYSIRILGAIGHESAEFDALELANVESNKRRFTMNYYTLSEGIFQLPEGFEPQSIEVQVQVKGNVVKQLFTWHDLLDTSVLPAGE